MSKPRQNATNEQKQYKGCKPVILRQILGSLPARPVFGSKRNWRRWKQPRPPQRRGHLHGHPERTQYCTWTNWDTCWNRNTHPVQLEFSTFIFVSLGIKQNQLASGVVVVVVPMNVLSSCGITMFVSGFRLVGVTCQTMSEYRSFCLPRQPWRRG